MYFTMFMVKIRSYSAHDHVYTANNCSESAVEWLQFHFSYSDPLHTIAVNKCNYCSRNNLSWFRLKGLWKLRFENVISFLKMMQKTQTKNCKNYFFHSSKTRVISSQSIYNARNAETTSDPSFFLKRDLVIITLKKLAKYRTDLI